MMLSCYIFVLSFMTLSASAQNIKQEFKLGIENISPETIAWLKTQRIGLIMNHTSKNQKNQRTVDILKALHIPIAVLLAPEHGIDGALQASHTVPHTVDQTTQIPIMSLYEDGQGKHINAAVADLIDTFIFDLQDCGMRHYTYISTLYYVLQGAAQYHKTVVVFDRPNPLGNKMEGPLVDQELHSFISIAPIPLRHGMTIAELARYFNHHILPKPVQLLTIAMQGYAHAAPSSLPMKLSPNIKKKEACYGYSFLGLLGEIRPFDVALETEKSFQCLLLPSSMLTATTWQKLAKLLEKYHIISSPYSYFSTRKKRHMSGLSFKIKEIHKVPSWTVFLTIVSFFKKEGISLSYSPTFDKAAGTTRIRKFLDGSISYAQLMTDINKQLEQFARQTHTCLLYPKA